MHPFSKSIYMIPTYLQISLKKLIEYKTAMYVMVLNQALAAGLWLIFWQALFNNIQSIGPWQFEEMALLTGFVVFSTSLWWVLAGVWRLPETVMRGDLNMSLIRPVPTLWHTIGKDINLVGLPRILIAAIIFVVAFTTLNIPFDAIKMILALIVSFISFITTMLPFLLICLATFWIGRADFVRNLFGEITVFQNYPVTVFPKAVAIIFTTIIPVIFTGTIPVLVLTTFTSKETAVIILIELIVLVAQIILINYFWKKGLARYESYGG